MRPVEILSSQWPHDREDAIRNLRCVSAPIGCGRQITEEELSKWSRMDLSEYALSGWCITCQDEVFGQCLELNCKHEDERDCACTCRTPCCEVDVGVGIITCGSQHC